MKGWYWLLAAVWPITDVAVAHPGHGPEGGGFSLLHYLTEPLHLAGLAVALLVGLGVRQWWRSRRGATEKRRGPLA